MRTILFTICMTLVALPGFSQEQTPQTRLVFHTVADLNSNWFVTNWTIGNVRAKAPDNINIFPGVGYRGKTWWTEAMVQRQWSPAGNSWAIDFRYNVSLSDRLSLYAESAPLLTHHGEYEFLILDVRAWRKLAVGVETENVHMAGRDSLGAGPRVSAPVATFGKYSLALGGVYQIRHTAADIPRLYVVLNRRFGR